MQAASYFRGPPGPTKIKNSYFRGPPGPTKIKNLFSSATVTDANTQPSTYFRRPWGSRRKQVIFVGTDEIVSYFRRTYFRRLFSSACRQKQPVFVGLRLFSWVFGPRKFRRFLQWIEDGKEVPVTRWDQYALAINAQHGNAQDAVWHDFWVC